MAKSPSLIALLGILAVAGYQNRDKLGSLLGGLGGNRDGATPGAGGSDGGLLGNLGGMFGGGQGGQGGTGGGIGGALSDLVDSFTGKGHGEVAQSWIETGPNRVASATDIEDSLGSDTIDDLAAKTGLPRAELLERLSAVLPVAVDGLTPDGRLPSFPNAGAAARA